MEVIEQTYGMLLTGAVIVLAVLIILSILRSVLGPGISDRIIAINMIGTMIIMIIAILSVYLEENYLVDVCLIYALISFLGVVVLCKVYTGVYLQRKHMKADLGAIADNLQHQEARIKSESGQMETVAEHRKETESEHTEAADRKKAKQEGRI